jgi:hypothetical protein
MKEPFKVFDYLNKAKVSQRDRFTLYLLAMLALVINSISGLVLVKQLPDLLEWIVSEILKHL